MLAFRGDFLRWRPNSQGVRLRFSTAASYRATTVVVNAVLAAVAFSQGTQGWDIVGAVLAGFAIADVMILAIASWFRWRHRDEDW